MDTTAKRRLAERVRRKLTQRLHARGFARGKPTFWVRPKEHVIEFVHLHLLTFAPVFRAHCGIRVLNDQFDAAALNGPDSDSTRSGSRSAYSLEFSDDEKSLDQCADAIARWCGDVAEPWFEGFESLDRLLSPGSPLADRQRADHEMSRRGEADPEAVRLSKQLLGVP